MPQPERPGRRPKRGPYGSAPQPGGGRPDTSRRPGGPRPAAGGRGWREEEGKGYVPPMPATRLNEDDLVQRPLSPSDGDWPVVVARSPTWQPFLYRRMLRNGPQQASAGDLARVVLEDGSPLGFGLYNPHAELAVRLLTHGVKAPDEVWWIERLQAAVELRRDFLKLDKETNAYRVVHAEADGLPGIVIDRLGDVLSIEAFSLGMYQRAEVLLDHLTAMLGTKHGALRCGPQTLDQEGFTAEAYGSEELPNKTTIQEMGTEFRVDFAAGHKTGFFCDQRDNRKMLAQFCEGKSVLDLCCYTGGFSLQAKRLGKAADVTGVDLDEDAIALAKENAQLNREKIQFVQADAFAYMRDMLRNNRQYDVVVLDPPKLARSREEIEEAKRKYFDFNRLAMQLVKPGGLLLTCSCSGLVQRHEFRQVVAASSEVGRRTQLLFETGAAADHPVAPRIPETEYLKAMWLRME